MKINVGINEDNKKIMFVTDDEGNNIGELVISEEYYNASLKEFEEGNK